MSVEVISRGLAARHEGGDDTEVVVADVKDRHLNQVKRGIPCPYG